MTFTVLPAVFGLDRRGRDMKREGAVPMTRAEQPELWGPVDEGAAAAKSAHRGSCCSVPPANTRAPAEVSAH